MRRILIGSALILALASTANAQTPAPTTGESLVVMQAGSVKGSIETLLTREWTCNLAPAPGLTTTVTNPNEVQIADPDPTHTGKACRMDITTLVRGLPPGTGYTLMATATSAAVAPPNDRATTATVAIPDFRVAPIYGPPVATSAFVITR